MVSLSNLPETMPTFFFFWGGVPIYTTYFQTNWNDFQPRWNDFQAFSLEIVGNDATQVSSNHQEEKLL